MSTAATPTPPPRATRAAPADAGAALGLVEDSSFVPPDPTADVEDVPEQVVLAAQKAIEEATEPADATVAVQQARQRYRELLESWAADFPPTRDYLSLSRRERAPVDKAIIRIGAYMGKSDNVSDAVRQARAEGRDAGSAVLDLDIQDIVTAGDISIELGIEVETAMVALAQDPEVMAEWARLATSAQIGRAAAWLTQLVGEAERRSSS